MPREFHLGIYEKCVQERRRAATLPGRGRLQGGQEASHVAALDDFIFPSVPELGTVYASPKMRGATASLVGEDFVMHPHRHMHSGMGGMDQNFHKDGHHIPMRHHRPRWIMGMYFCTDTTIEMGPTGVVSGSQYWLCDKQNWAELYTGEEPADPAAKEKFESAREEFMSAMTTTDTELRDHVFEQCGKAFGAEQYRAVCKAGSVLFIHFDILHRASRQEPTDPEGRKVWDELMAEALEAQVKGRIRMADQASFSDKIGVKWRPNFKLQYFRVSDPVRPTWLGADPTGTTDSFAYTGASPQQQAVWQSIYDWMKGEGVSAAALSEADVGRLSGLINTLEGVAAEPERIGSAYALGRGAKAGSESALAALVAALESDTERINRAGMHGMATSGQAGVPALLQLIAEAVPTLEEASGHGRLLVKQCIHALAEALEQPDVASVTAMVSASDAARAALLAHEERNPSGEALPHGASKEQRDAKGRVLGIAAELRQIVATSMATLGCVAERSAAAGDVEACAVIADCLIGVAGEEEVGSGSGSTPDAATAIPELARESATHGLIRLASTGSVDSSLAHRAAVAGCDVSGNHRHYAFVAGFATEAALRCFEDEPTPVREMLGAKLRAAAETSEWWAEVCSGAPSMFRGAEVAEVNEFWQRRADPFGKPTREWQREGLTTFIEL